jgi:hypothetical protein
MGRNSDDSFNFLYSVIFLVTVIKFINFSAVKNFET